MFVDAREIPQGSAVEAEVCIIGAGAAGITLAREFLQSPFRTCLVESGGFESDTVTQELYKGRNTGIQYYDLDACRLRYFGGTTNHWGGCCRPLDEFDFEPHPWLPYSGWPLKFDELKPYYVRAQQVCELQTYGYDFSFLREQLGYEVLPSTKQMITEVIQFSPPTRFGEVYRAEIAAAQNVTAVLHGNVIEIETSDTPNLVSAVRVSTLDQRTFFVAAKYYILAVGGLENPRLLLISNKTKPAGLGNEFDLVGRFFMDHPEAHVGELLPAEPARRVWTEYCDCGAALGRNPLQALAVLAPSKRILEDEQILHCTIGLNYAPEDSPGWTALRGILRRNNSNSSGMTREVWQVLTDIEGIANEGYQKLRYGYVQPKLFGVYCWGQAAPNPDSRVTIDSTRDRLGLPQLKLDFRLSEIDLRSMKTTLEFFSRYIGATGMGRVKRTFDEWSSQIPFGYHHMGTTRMSAHPQNGVVNKDCRLHNIENLYVAGSSVFPTSGSANPTLTIVALSLRLADQIKRSLKT